MIPPYDFYVATYCGKLSEPDYQAAAVKAEAYVRQITMRKCDRVGLPAQVTQAVMLCICELSDVIHRDTTSAAAAGIASESNDGISMSYRAPSVAEQEREKRTIAQTHLAWSGLLFSGMGGGWPC